MDPIIKSLDKIFNRLVVPKIDEAYSSVGVKNSVTVRVDDNVLQREDEGHMVDAYVIIIKFNGEFPPWSGFYDLCYMFLNISKYVMGNNDYALVYVYDDGTSTENFTFYSSGDNLPFEYSLKSFREGLIQRNLERYMEYRKGPRNI